MKCFNFENCIHKLILLALIALIGLSVGVAQAADAKKDIKVGFVYISPVDGEGWSYAHDMARKELEKMPGVTTTFVENIPKGLEFERIILNMARNSIDIIIATSFNYMNSMLKIAKQFPKTIFMQCAGYKTTPNIINYFGRIYQARYLTGMVAGAMTKNNKIGYVAAFPIPKVICGINAFTLGVHKCWG